ncbi:hypothetical protein HK104_011026 [Borealophlyctis nickersoniae]|nr:hypothetical protein HK104_011026 [Borealophlyctis nickersoniae]
MHHPSYAQPASPASDWSDLGTMPGLSPNSIISDFSPNMDDSPLHHHVSPDLPLGDPLQQPLLGNLDPYFIPAYPKGKRGPDVLEDFFTDVKKKRLMATYDSAMAHRLDEMAPLFMNDPNGDPLAALQPSEDLTEINDFLQQLSNELDDGAPVPYGGELDFNFGDPNLFLDGSFEGVGVAGPAIFSSTNSVGVPVPPYAVAAVPGAAHVNTANFALDQQLTNGVSDSSYSDGLLTPDPTLALFATSMPEGVFDQQAAMSSPFSGYDSMSPPYESGPYDAASYQAAPQFSERVLNDNSLFDPQMMFTMPAQTQGADRRKGTGVGKGAEAAKDAGSSRGGAGAVNGVKPPTGTASLQPRPTPTPTASATPSRPSAPVSRTVPTPTPRAAALRATPSPLPTRATPTPTATATQPKPTPTPTPTDSLTHQLNKLSITSQSSRPSTSTPTPRARPPSSSTQTPQSEHATLAAKRRHARLVRYLLTRVAKKMEETGKVEGKGKEKEGVTVQQQQQQRQGVMVS